MIRSRPSAVVKLVVIATVAAFVVYGAYGVVAYRFTDSDYDQLRASSDAANVRASEAAQAIYAAIPDGNEVIAYDGSQEGIDQDCSDVIYPAKQGFKKIFCQHTFVIYVGINEENVREVEASLIETLSSIEGNRAQSVSGQAGNRSYSWDLGDPVNKDLSFKVHQSETKWTANDVKKLLAEYDNVFDIYYRDGYAVITKQRNIFELLK